MTLGFCSLVNRARAGNQAAIEELMAQLGPKVRQMCELAAAGDSGISASDLTQDVWLRVWTHLHQFQGGEDDRQTRFMFLKWARLTAKSVIHRRWQYRQAQRRRPGGVRLRLIERPDSQQGDGHVPAGREANPAHLAGQAELVERLTKALAEMPDATCRKIVQLKFEQGMSFNKIGDELGLHPDQVRRRFYRTLQDLQSTFGENSS